MKLCKLCERLNIIESTADMNTDIKDICYDSRKVQPGSLFVAINGLSVDGNQFIPSAIEKGASAVVCEKKPHDNVPYILVDDSRTALSMLSCARYDYPADKMKIIGVTGTAGKTTTTNLIKYILENTADIKVGLIGTNVNMIGNREIHTEFTTPESDEVQKLFKEMVDEGCTYCVMEVSSHALYMHRVGGITFSTGAYTNLSQDHLDIHETMDEYARVKSTLFTKCVKCCINLDDDYSDVMISNAACPVMTTSVNNNNADMTASNICNNEQRVSFTVKFRGETCDCTLNIPGLFSVYNALTAISVCVSEGISLKDCCDALNTAHGVKGRMERVPTDGDYSIIIDYSHKPDPLEKVLKTLRGVTRGRLICLFGCGGDRDRDKRHKMGKIASDNADIVIVTSDNPRTEDPMAIINEILPGVVNSGTYYEVICDRINAIHRAIDIARDGDVVLLAGKGHEDYQVIGHEKIHMDEREIVAEYLKER